MVYWKRTYIRVTCENLLPHSFNLTYYVVCKLVDLLDVLPILYISYKLVYWKLTYIGVTC